MKSKDSLQDEKYSRAPAPSPAVAVEREMGRAVAIALASAAAGLAVGSVVLYATVGRSWHRRWGATGDEVSVALPGDDLVPAPRINVTHAVTIDAPPAAVWPWLVQLGQGRGGFYSYTWVENALNADIQNSDRVLPEHQNLAVGDLIPLAAPSKDLPDGMGFPVVILEQEKALVLHGDTRRDEGRGAPPMAPGSYLNTSWGFYLFPLDGGRRTRLVERWRADYPPTTGNKLMWGIGLEAGAFVMQRKMLLGIRERAEKPSPVDHI